MITLDDIGITSKDIDKLATPKTGVKLFTHNDVIEVKTLLQPSTVARLWDLAKSKKKRSMMLTLTGSSFMLVNPENICAIEITELE